MGGCCGKEDADEHRRPPPGRRPSRPRAFQGAGHTLGGGGADSNTQGVDARDAAAMAAMQRANNAGGTDRDRKMAERRQKDELVGKILREKLKGRLGGGGGCCGCCDLIIYAARFSVCRKPRSSVYRCSSKQI